MVLTSLCPRFPFGLLSFLFVQLAKQTCLIRWIIYLRAAINSEQPFFGDDLLIHYFSLLASFFRIISHFINGKAISVCQTNKLWSLNWNTFRVFFANAWRTYLPHTFHEYLLIIYIGLFILSGIMFLRSAPVRYLQQSRFQSRCVLSRVCVAKWVQPTRPHSSLNFSRIRFRSWKIRW